jgi:hypothetical protein
MKIHRVKIIPDKTQLPLISPQIVKEVQKQTRQVFKYTSALKKAFNLK